MLANNLKLMEHEFAGALERYLCQTLHARIRVQPFGNVSSLPSFLARSYKLYETQIAGRRCVFVTTGVAAGTPSDVAKHVALVRSDVNDAVVVFAAPSLSAHNRSRLLAQGVAFVVPGNQLYIPELAMDLREHFRAPRPQTVDGLSPAAQAVLFLHLLRRNEGATTPSAIAERLRYSAMSIGRAFDYLTSAGLADTEKLGKERHLRFKTDRRALLEDARELLRSPVRSVKFIRDGHIGPFLKRGGESALSELTDLSPPRIETWAVAADNWKTVAKTGSLVETDEYDATFIVETWYYDPAWLSDGPVVDPLSLYAQFKDHDDERIAMAVERLLEKVSW